MHHFRVHRVNFFHFEPNAIHCLCYDEESSLLALSRADNSIEIWNLRYTPFLERVINSRVDSSVEAVVWCQGRLFSTGLSAYVLEYDINTLSVKNSLSITGGATWCLAASKDQKHLAAGTEDGFISLFDVSDEGFQFSRLFDKQEGRILCMAWHESGKHLATGSINTIRVWNVESGQAITRILVSSIEKKTETIVWCLAFLRNHTIVSGDSWGRTIFWDSLTGTQLNSMRVHKVDVLALCVDQSERNVYASGVNPMVAMFSQVEGRDGQKGWVKSYTNTMHTHDVRAITIAGNSLITGGVDTYLAVTSFQGQKRCLLYHPLQQVSTVKVAPKTRSLLFQRMQSLDVWQLGSTDDAHEGTDSALHLSKMPCHLLQLKMKEGESVTCSAVSQDMSWLAYSTTSSLRLYSFSLDEDPVTGQTSPNLTRVRFIPEECRDVPCTSLAFTPDGTTLIIITAPGDVHLLTTNLVQPSILHTFQTEYPERQHLLTCSTTGAHFATATHSGKVVVYSVSRKKVCCSLPTCKSQATALAFHPTTEHLFVIYSDQRLVEYDISKLAYAPCCSQWEAQSIKCLSPHRAIRRITFNPLHPDLVILHDDEAAYFFTKDTVTKTASPKKYRREKTHPEEEEVRVKVCQNYKHLLAFLHLDGKEMAAVEVTPGQLISTLPSAYRGKQYGT